MSVAMEESLLAVSDGAALLLSSPGVCLARLSSRLEMRSSEHVSFVF